jgi:hypothetical protein
MADRFPLIFNTNADQIQELAASDNLDLASSNLTNVANIDVAGLSTFSGAASLGVTTVSSVGVNTSQAQAKLYVDGNSASNVVTLTDGATITPDFSQGNNFSVVLGGNRTLANPTGITTGQTGVIYVIQDGTGSRTLGIGSHFHFSGGTAPTFTTTANAVDAIAFSVRSSTSIFSNAILDIKTTAT